ncbi:MAG: M13 family metallopeptidase N-terminal domain-containing protein, partial [Pseudomonadota bacterium]
MKSQFFKSAAVIALAGVGLVACADDGASPAAGGEKAVTEASAAAPELGAWGVETDYIDPSVAAGDDFYTHVSGKWLDTFKIPDEFSSYGSFTVLFERSEKRVREIIESLAAATDAAAGSTEQKVGDYFAAFTDVDAIDAAGLTPLTDDFAAIDAAETHADIANFMGSPDTGGQAVFSAFVNVDSKQPDRYIMYIGQGGLGMPNRTYYLEEKLADKAAAYKVYIEKMLTLANIDGAADKAAAIYAVEEELARVHWEPAKRRNRDLTYNL